MPTEILKVDDVLIQLTYATTDMRNRLLGRVAMLPPDQITPEQHQGVVGRWAPLLIELGEWQRAYEVLETLPQITPDSPLGFVKFESALLTGRYDIAIQMNDTPDPWIGVLSQIATLHPDAAIRLRDEISTRFNGRLVGEVKTAFDSASGRIPPPDATQITNGQSDGVGGQKQ